MTKGRNDKLCELVWSTGSRGPTVSDVIRESNELIDAILNALAESLGKKTI